jgi:thiol:disulfide interchange protein
MTTPLSAPRTGRAVVLGLLLLLAALALPAALPGTAVAAAAMKTAPAKHAVVPFIDDDLDRALAEAKKRDLPLFIESWAPW